MTKAEELANPNSCINRAKDDETLFVLLGRDVAAPVAIRAWAKERVRVGKNHPTDTQIIEALTYADQIEKNFEALARSIQSA